MSTFRGLVLYAGNLLELNPVSLLKAFAKTMSRN